MKHWRYNQTCLPFNGPPITTPYKLLFRMKDGRFVNFSVSSRLVKIS